ncbi:MAG: GNAT family N-acetyltransferase [Steroidobacteraceae bacterium]
MSAVKTRLATAADLDQVAALFDGYRQFYEHPSDLALSRRYITERFQRQESVILVAEGGDGKLVGFTQMYPTFCSLLAAPSWILYDLFVSRAARGAGAGRALLLAAEAHAKEKGVARLELSTARTNIIGQSLYESLGWKLDETYLVYHRKLRS